MNFFALLLTALFFFSCTSRTPSPTPPPTGAKKPGQVKTKMAVEERSVCGSLKKWQSSGWFEKCENEMEGSVFDSTALNVCEKLAPLFNSAEESMRCLNTIKSTEYAKVEYDEAALEVCDRLTQWEKTKYDAIWCLSIIKNKKYTRKTINNCLKLAKPSKNVRKSLYQLDVEGLKI